MGLPSPHGVWRFRAIRRALSGKLAGCTCLRAAPMRSQARVTRTRLGRTAPPDPSVEASRLPLSGSAARESCTGALIAARQHSHGQIGLQTRYPMMGAGRSFWFGFISRFRVRTASSVGAWLFASFLVPESKGKSLERLEKHRRLGKWPRELSSRCPQRQTDLASILQNSLDVVHASR